MKIKFAIIGCGHIAKRHAKHLQAHPNAELLGGFDLVVEKTQNFATDFEVKAFESLEEVLQSPVDMLNICTPNGTHHSIAIEALNAGKHVLVEKPMAIRKADSEQMIKAALDNGKNLFVVKQNRFNPPVQEVKKLLENGHLGKVFSVVVNAYWNRNKQYYEQSYWRGTKELDGGTLFTQFSHFIDILYYLFGDVDLVSGITKNVNHQGLIEFEDTGHFVFQLKTSGALGSFNYTTAAYEKNMEGSITIFAENGSLKIGGQYLNTIEYQSIEGKSLNEFSSIDKPNDYGFYQGSMSNHDKVIDNVVKSLLGQEKIMTNAYDGLKVVEIIENFYAVANHLNH